MNPHSAFPRAGIVGIAVIVSAIVFGCNGFLDLFSSANHRPTVIINERSVTVANGASATFTAVASDADGDRITYQWSVDSVAQSGATGSSFTAAFSPAAQTTYGISVQVSDGKDKASDTVTLTVLAPVLDLAPVPTITSLSASVVNTSPILVTVTFDEQVTGFEIDDLIIGNGTASNFQTMDNTAFTFDVAPAAHGAVTVDVPAAVAQSVSTGTDNAAADQFVVMYDIEGPSVMISSIIAGPTSASPIPIMATFSEPVIGFELSDLVVGNGAASNLQTSDDTVFTFDATPAGDGMVTVDIAEAVATDSVGNPNSAAAQFTIEYGATGANIVYAGTYDLYDYTSYSTDGNNDGKLNAGETVRLDIAIQNTGWAQASGVTADISTTDPYVTLDIAYDSYAFGTLDAGYYDSIYDYSRSLPGDLTVNAATYSAFRFVVDSSAPVDHVVTFNLVFTDGSANTWTDSFTLTVVQSAAAIEYAGKYDIYGYSSYSTVGDNDNLVMPGETVRMDVAIRHIDADGGVLRDLSGTLSTSTSGVTVVSGSQTIVFDDYIPAGYYDSYYDGTPKSLLTDLYVDGYGNSFLFQVAGSVSPGTDIAFTIDFTDRFGNTWQVPFTVPVSSTTATVVTTGDYSVWGYTSYGTDGDNDVLVQPGETVNMDFKIQAQNSGTSYIRNLTATISTSSAGVAVTALRDSYLFNDVISPDYYDSLASSPNSSASSVTVSAAGSSSRFNFSVADTVAPGTSIVFNVTFTDYFGNTWNDTLTVAVSAFTTTVVATGDYAVWGYSSYDTIGDNDFLVQPGETVNMDFKIQGQNTGASYIRDISATISTTTPGVTVTAGRATFLFATVLNPNYYDSLNSSPNATASNVSLSATSTYSRFNFAVADTVAPGTDIVFDVVFTDHFGNTWNDTLTVAVSAFTTTVVATGDYALWGYSSYDTIGDNDVLVQPGETVNMDFKIQGQNTGTSYIRDLYATISTSTPGVTVTAGRTTFLFASVLNPGYYDSLASSPNATASNITVSATSSYSRFNFAVAKTVAPGTNIVFDVVFSDYFGNTWNDTLTVPVSSFTTDIAVTGDYALWGYTSYDTDGDNDGLVQPGETVNMDFKIQGLNTGSSYIRDLYATISTETPGVTVTAGRETFLFTSVLNPNYYDSLASSQNASASSVTVNAASTYSRFNFSVADTVAPGTNIVFTVVFTDYFTGVNHPAWSKTLTIPVSSTTASLSYGGEYAVYDGTSYSTAATNSNGSIQAGETVRLDFEIFAANTGTSKVRDLVGVLTPNTAGVTVIENNKLFDDIIDANCYDAIGDSPDASDANVVPNAAGSTRFLVSVGSSVTSDLDFTLTLTDRYGHEFPAITGIVVPLN